MALPPLLEQASPPSPMYAATGASPQLLPGALGLLGHFLRFLELARHALDLLLQTLVLVGEKGTITNNIKKIKDLHEQYEERIAEVKHKYETTVKEKVLLKLEKDKLSKRIVEIQKTIKHHEDAVSKGIEESHKRQMEGLKNKNKVPVKG